MSTHTPHHRFSDYADIPFEVFIATFTVLPILVLIYFYPVLPERIPEYLNLRGEVAVWGRKGFVSVFRLPLMAIDLQVLCLLSKYGLWQSKVTQPFEQTEKHAIYREGSVKLQMNLWDWFRALIAVKLGTSSLEVIFLSIERFNFLSTPVRVISWTVAILGIVGVVFYGYRLIKVNAKLKEAGGNEKVPTQIDASHLRGSVIYYNPADPSIFKDKYLFNFANKWIYVFLVCLICLPLLMFLPMLKS
jgi:uncharacterized membrane protein